MKNTTFLLTFIFVVNLHSQCWKEIKSGYDHTLAIHKNGTLWSWGSNAHGQLGNGTRIANSIPTQLGVENDWVYISTKSQSSFAIKSNGSLWSWGRNIKDQLGDSTDVDRLVPMKIGNSNDWKIVENGANHTIGIKQDGSLWAWGLNIENQLGDGTDTNRFFPVRIGIENNWEKVSCGFNHTLAIKKNGTLWAWGWNSIYQLGNNSNVKSAIPIQIGTANNWKEIGAGSYISFGLQTNNSLWAWGANGHGSIGDSTNIDRTVPTVVGNVNNWLKISVGWYHILALKVDSTLWGWGANGDGQIGSGETNHLGQNFPVQITMDKGWNVISAGHLFSHSIKQNGTLWAWGKLGALGIEHHYTHSDVRIPLPVLIDISNDWKEISGGDKFTIAIKNDGSLWSWGANNYGQLGDGTTNGRIYPKMISSDKTWKKVSCGMFHTLAIKDDGSLWGWGINNYNQLGDSLTTPILSPRRIGHDNDWKEIACSEIFSAGLKTNGILWFVGKQFWRLDSPYTWRSITSRGLGFVGHRTDGTLWSIRDRYFFIQIGTGSDWAKAASGGLHVLAIKNDGTLWCQGNNSYGQLGIGNYFNTNSMVQIGSKNNWSEIDAGTYHSLAIDNDSNLWAWGENSEGQLGNGTYTSTNVPSKLSGSSNWTRIFCGTFHSMAMRNDGSLWSCGRNDKGQTGSDRLTNDGVFDTVGSLYDFCNQQLKTRQISIITNPNYGGSVLGGGIYNLGDSCIIVPTANSGFIFKNLTENGNIISTSTTYKIKVESDRYFTANFDSLKYNVNATSNPLQGGNISGSGNYVINGNCSLIATPSLNYSFKNWTEGANIVGTNANYNFLVKSNRALLANFVKNINNITHNVNNEHFKVYPTNFIDKVCVETIEPRGCTVKVIKINGQKIFESAINSKITYLNLENLVKGKYIMLLYCHDDYFGSIIISKQ
jgi:alpha-tubulin suppressor-like RCC1 family protein